MNLLLFTQKHFALPSYHGTGKTEQAKQTKICSHAI